MKKFWESLTKTDKFMVQLTVVIILLLILLAFCVSAHAHCNHCSIYLPPAQETTNVTNVTNNVSGDELVAMGVAAAQLHPDINSKGMQFGAGIGRYRADNAFSLGLGYSTGDTMFSGTLVRSNGESAFGAGINFKF